MADFPKITKKGKNRQKGTKVTIVLQMIFHSNFAMGPKRLFDLLREQEFKLSTYDSSELVIVHWVTKRLYLKGRLV